MAQSIYVGGILISIMLIPEIQISLSKGEYLYQKDNFAPSMKKNTLSKAWHLLIEAAAWILLFVICFLFRKNIYQSKTFSHQK